MRAAAKGVNQLPLVYVPPVATTVDLFCGGGGLTYGLRKAGLPVDAGIDIDSECEYIYEANNPGSKFVTANLKEYTSSEVDKLFSKAQYKILVGCAPCQSFSKYTRKQKFKTDAKWELVKTFADLVCAIKPTVVSMENVPELAAHEVYDDFVTKLKSEGYHVSASVIYCPAYGVPQQRERLVLFASLLGTIDITGPTHEPDEYPTVESAIGTMEKLVAGQTSNSDTLHKCSKLSPLNLERIQASSPGGTWRDWPVELRATCHQAETGATYPSVYGRMEWRQPAPTITTQYFGFGNGRFGHPEQDRAISLREGAILQSFPKDYVLSKPGNKITFANVGRMIGNAVPPKLGEAVGRTIVEHLRQHNISI